MICNHIVSYPLLLPARQNDINYSCTDCYHYTVARLGRCFACSTEFGGTGLTTGSEDVCVDLCCSLRKMVTVTGTVIFLVIAALCAALCCMTVTVTVMVF